jgi:hypothetical protein
MEGGQPSSYRCMEVRPSSKEVFTFSDLTQLSEPGVSCEYSQETPKQRLVGRGFLMSIITGWLHESFCPRTQSVTSTNGYSQQHRINVSSEEAVDIVEKCA